MLFRYILVAPDHAWPCLIVFPVTRCQTCPQAFCEDCLPDGELDAVGDVLPELYVFASHRGMRLIADGRF